MDKLTDIEIVKALDSYKKDIGCAKCGFKDKYLFTVIENALDLINRTKANENHYRQKVQNQKEELKRLNEVVNSLQAENERLTTS